MPTSPKTERELVDLLLTHLDDRLATSTGSLVKAVEVRSHGRALIDVCVIREGELLAMEAKLHDWKGAISQAFFNRYCVDRSYIVLWHSKVKAEIVSDAVGYGVGVMAVHSDHMEIVQDVPTGQPRQALRAAILNRLRSNQMALP